MDEGMHSGTLSQSPSALATDLWACVTEAGWRRRWACICTGRESGGRMDGGWGKDSTQAQSDDWVMDGDRERDDGQVRSASRTRVHGYWVGVPWCVWVIWVT